MTPTLRRRAVAVATALGLVLAAAAAALRPTLARALDPVPATPTSQHFYAAVHTDLGGFAISTPTT